MAVESGENKTPAPVLRRYSENMYLLFKSEEEAVRYPEGMIAGIVVMKNTEGEWGYWHCDSSKNERKWVAVEISEDVKDLPPEL
jgi:hypothetical protein